MTDVSSRDQRQFQSIHINDFSPGCYDASLTIGASATNPGFNPGPFPAPMGAADANFTHACMALPTGGLGPLPALTATHSLSDFSINPSNILGAFNLLAMANTQVLSGDELVIGFGFINSSTLHYNAYVYSAVWSTLASNSIFTANYAQATPPTFNYPLMPYVFSTRVAASSPSTTVGQALMVIPIIGGNNLVLYPNPSSPTSFTGLDINSGPLTTVGVTVGHQGRIVTVGSETRSWPASIAGNFSNQFFELVSFTDPPNSETLGNQQEVFGPENPYGYGGIGSVSAGELFMVKQRGGAIIVQGDIANPTVTTLPGVKSTGGFYGQVGEGEAGMFYCSQDQGAYVWNGGNTSQKVSTQLDDNFYNVTNAVGNNTANTYGYYCQRWGEWMLFSNNWLYNMATGGWWRLSDPTVFQWFFYTPGYHENNMYAGITALTSSSTVCLGQYDKTVPAAAYQWQCLPIRPNAADRTISVRGVTVRASNPTLDANAQITVSIVDGSGAVHQAGAPWKMLSSTRDVQIQNFNSGVRSEDIVVRLACSGTSAAPIIYDLVVDYRSREQAART